MSTPGASAGSFEGLPGGAVDESPRTSPHHRGGKTSRKAKIGGWSPCHGGLPGPGAAVRGEYAAPGVAHTGSIPFSLDARDVPATAILVATPPLPLPHPRPLPATRPSPPSPPSHPDPASACSRHAIPPSGGEARRCGGGNGTPQYRLATPAATALGPLGATVVMGGRWSQFAGGGRLIGTPQRSSLQPACGAPGRHLAAGSATPLKGSHHPLLPEESQVTKKKTRN